MDKKPAFTLPLAAYGANQHSEPDVRTEPPKHRGETQAYLLRRLARDAPEVAALVGKKNIATFATANQ